MNHDAEKKLEDDGDDERFARTQAKDSADMWMMMAKWNVPEKFRAEMIGYFFEHRRPSRFIEALLRNDFGVLELALFIQQQTPIRARGNAERVAEWLRGEVSR